MANYNKGDVRKLIADGFNKIEAGEATIGQGQQMLAVSLFYAVQLSEVAYGEQDAPARVLKPDMLPLIGERINHGKGAWDTDNAELARDALISYLVGEAPKSENFPGSDGSVNQSAFLASKQKFSARKSMATLAVRFVLALAYAGYNELDYAEKSGFKVKSTDLLPSGYQLMPGETEGTVALNNKASVTGWIKSKSGETGFKRFKASVAAFLAAQEVKRAKNNAKKGQTLIDAFKYVAATLKPGMELNEELLKAYDAMRVAIVNFENARQLQEQAEDKQKKSA